MISFEKVNQFDKLYHILNYYFYFAHSRLYYRNVRIIGEEHIPQKGVPTFVIANHQNALMDALAILYLFKNKRQPIFIARGDIFKKNVIIAKLLRFLKILPTFRSRDGGRDDIRSNLETFDLAARFLNEGATVCMFPEAKHQPGKFFATFKKGYPRLAFRSAELSDYQNNLKVLPIAIYYTNYFHMHYDLVMVIGEPFGIEPFYEQFKTEPNNAYFALNEKSKAIIQELGIDVKDEEHYAQYETTFAIGRKKMMAKEHWPEHDPYSAMLSDKKIMEVLDETHLQQPEKFSSIMLHAADYKDGMEKLNLRTWQLEQTTSAFRLILRFLWLLISFPLFLFGFINNFIPFYACELPKKNLQDKMFTSTINFTVSVIVMYPLCYLLLFVLVALISHSCLFSLAYLVASFITMFVQYGWRKYAIKTFSLCRYRRYERTKNALLAKIKSARESILSDLGL